MQNQNTDPKGESKLTPEIIFNIDNYVKENNIDLDGLRSDVDESISNNNPTLETSFAGDQELTPDEVSVDHGFFDDLGASIVNGLVMDLGEGLGNLAPTLAQIGGADNEFLSNWKSNVTGFFEDNRLGYDSAANKDISEFGDINSTHIATGLGQGIGFIASIIAGGAGFAKLGIKALSASTKTLATASKVGVMTTKGLKAMETVNRASKIGGRIGSFVTGTTLMYPMIEKDAKAAGLNNVDAARFAMGVSAIVSMTEGAALEWAGVVASKPFTSALAKKTASSQLKNLSMKNMSVEAKLKAFTSTYSQKFSHVFSKGIKGAAIEMGQEFGQTYIEEGSKQLYDTVFSKDKEVGDDKFGTDTGVQSLWGGEYDKDARYKTFVQATFAGAIGGLLGGGMGSAGALMGRGKAKDDLAQETMFGYINNSVQTNNPKGIEELYTGVDSMVERDQVTEEEGVNIKENIKQMKEFAVSYGNTDIKDGVALLQLFQLDKSRKNIVKQKESIENKENDNPVKVKYDNEIKSKLDIVEERIQKHFADIFLNKKPNTKNKIKFENQLSSYDDIAEEIGRSNIDEEVINKKLDKIFKIESESKEQKSSFGKTSKNKDGLIFTEKSLTDEAKEDIKLRMSKTMSGNTTQEDKDAVYLAIKEEYGIEKESAFAISINKIGDLNEEVENEETENEETTGAASSADLNQIGDKIKKSKLNSLINEKKNELKKLESLDNVPLGERSLLKRKKNKLKEEILRLEKESKDEAESESEKTNDYSKSTDEEIWNKKQTLQKDIEALGNEANVFALSALQKELTSVNEEYFKREGKEFDDYAKDIKSKSQEDRTDKLKKQQEKRRNRKKNPKQEYQSYSKELKVNDDNTVEFKNKKYEIVTDEKGSVVGLKRNNKTITDESLLVETEIARDRQDVSFKSIERKHKEIDEEISDSVPFDEVKTIDNILELDLTDEIADLLNEGVDENTSASSMYKLDLYINSVLDALDKSQLSGEYAGSIHDALIDLQIQLNEQYENRIKPEESYAKNKEISIAKDEKLKSELEKQKPTKKKVKAFKTKGTTSSKLNYAQRGNGEYYALDKPFQEIGQDQEVEEVEVEYDEATTLDITTEEGMDKYNEIVSKLPTKFESIEELNQAKADAIQEAGYTALIGPIDQDNKKAGRELVIYDEKSTSNKEQQQGEVVDESVTPEVQAEIDEKVKANEQADLLAIMNIVQSTTSKDQRKRADSNDAQLIKNNPELYAQIKKHFKKIFPFIPVRTVNKLGEKYGAKVLARLVESGIEIDETSAIQTSLVHEYGHVFLEALGENHPLVKLGYKIIKGTEFHKQAIKDYPDYTEAQQLNEALTEAIAVDSLEILENKFEGAKLKQFQAWAKSIWSRLKKYVGRANQQDITRILAREMTLSKKPFVSDLKSLVGFSKDQRKNVVIPNRIKKTVDLVYRSLSMQLLEHVSNKESKFNFKTKAPLSLASYMTLLERYYQEKNKTSDSSNNIYDSIDLGIELKDTIYKEKKELTQEDQVDIYKRIKEFEDKLKKIAPEVYESADRVISSMFNSKLELEEKIEIEDTKDQSTVQENKGSDSSIKSTKRVSISVRSILSTMVDDSGGKIGSDIVFSYLSNKAEKSYKKAGLIAALKKDLSNPIARRFIELVDSLDAKNSNPEITFENKRKRAGLLQEVSSLIQVKSEGVNFSSVVNEDGTVTYKVTNPIRNKDRGYHGLKTILENLTDTESKWLSSLTQSSPESKAVKEFYYSNLPSKDLNKFIKKFSDVLNINITEDSLKDIIDSFKESYWSKNDINRKQINPIGSLKYTKQENFIFALSSTVGKSPSLAKLSLGMQIFEDITGIIDKIFLGLKTTLLNNTYLNGANNNVTTTQLGHWVSTFNSMLMNDESGRVEAMKKSDIYKNNPVFKYFVKEGGVDYSTFDSTKNFGINSNVEYSKMTESDYMILQLSNFATTSSKENYSQTLGAKSNRQSISFFKVPNYNNSNGKFDAQKLKEAYDNQVLMLEPILKRMLRDAKGKTNEALIKKDLIEDFNKLYIHTADSSGNITSGLNNDKYINEINQLKNIAKDNNLDQAFGKKIGKDNQFPTFNNMVENFFYIEAINRTSLNDIYGGVALEYANLVAGQRSTDADGNKIRTKMGVQQNTKRMSSSDSNGKQIEIDKPIHYIVFDSGLSGADSFKFNGTHLTNHIDKETGSIDPLGINSKELVFQVDPKTGKTVYIKSSGLNLKRTENGTNLDDFGDNVNALAQAMLKAEEQLAKELGDPNPYVVFMDSSASKGTHKFNEVNFQDLMDGNMDSIKGKVNTITIDNLTTPFNINKTLNDVHEQEAILSTQAAIIQFNANIDIETFEDAASKYLFEKMKKRGKETQGVVDQLLDYNNNIEELTKDMNEREKSSTTEILEAIKKHNKTAKKEDQINTFDHPSLKAVYEQFVASRLAKRGTKIDMPGNFMHQLPDISGKGKKLKGKEVAVSWKMFFNEKPTDAQEKAFLASADNKVAVVRIPSSAEMSMFGGTVAYFLDTDANVVVLSDEFVKYSDSDHDGDKAMVYRREMNEYGKFISEKNSFKTKMFNSFYNNLITSNFEKKRTETTLSLDPIRKAVGVMEGDFSTSTINKMVEVAKKMGLGQVATGRFSIAGKLMSLLSQSKEKINNPITYNNEILEYFTNDSLDDIARLLQAALDIGNDPILSETGFTESTINTGNAMLLLGVNVEEVISLLKKDAIVNLQKNFNKTSIALSKSGHANFDEFFNELTSIYDDNIKSYRKKTLEELSTEELDGKKIGMEGAIDIENFSKFKTIGDDLSKMRSYIELDKQLPKNAALNRALMEDISSFKDLSFTTENLVKRSLNKHRVFVAKEEGRIFSKQLLTSNPVVLNVIEKISILTENKYAFAKNAAESIMKIFAQKQIVNPSKDVTKWFYDFGNKISSIKNVSSNPTITNNTKDQSLVENIYKFSQSNPSLSIRNSIIEYAGAASFDEKRIAHLESLLNKYESSINESESLKRFSKNNFIQYVEITKDENDKLLLKLDPKYKNSSDITNSIKEGFLELQEMNPELAQEFINYQLYRYGVNNKIGSFIDVLPKNIDINQLTDVSKFKKNIESMDSSKATALVEKEFTNNLIFDNKSLLSNIESKNIIDNSEILNEEGDIKSFQLKQENLFYVNYNNKVYYLSDSKLTYLLLGNIQGDENFTAFENKVTQKSTSIDKAPPKAPQTSEVEKALTGMHWYDYEGNTFTKKDFDENVAKFQKENPGFEKFEYNQKDTPAGDMFNVFFYSPSEAQAILDKNNILIDIKTFLKKSQDETFTGKEKKAIDELYSTQPTQPNASEVDLGTETAPKGGKVVIDTLKGKKPQPGAVVAFRTKGKTEQNMIDALKDDVVGNPFGPYAAITENDIGTAVSRFLNWLEGTEDTNVMQAYRQAVLDKVPELKDKTIYYYKDLGRPSHATALDYFLNKPTQPNASEVINIYAGTNENAELSNFANRPYTNELGVEFRNVEAAFQYAKTNWAGGDNNPNNDSIRMELQTATGAQAKALGKKIKGLDVKAWDQNSEAIMKSIIKDSFEQNPKALEKLLATGNATLTHTQDKTKWGKLFPKILMEVRQELGGSQPSQQTSEGEIEEAETKEEKPTFTFNPEQQEAIDKTAEFIENGNSEEWHVIEGKAGTGKTTIAEQIAKKFPDKEIAVAALSNKATKVIKSKFNEANIPAKFSSIAGLLGMRENPKTGQFESLPKKDWESAAPIEEANIIMIDEASMVNEEMLELIFKNKLPDAKVVFLGDIGQLPPIRTEENPYYKNKKNLFGKDSPTFNSNNKSKLITRVRQGEESPILPFADNYWNNSQSENPTLNPSPITKNIITDKGALLFTSSFNDIKNQVIDAFKKGLKDNNSNYIKIVTYRNNKRKAINKYIHDKLFPNEEYAKGDLVIFNAPFSIKGKPIASNSDEGRIVSIEEVRDEIHSGETIKVYELAIDINGEIEYGIPVVSKSSEQKWDKILDIDKKKSRDLYNKGDKAGGNRSYAAFKKKSNLFAKIDYAYAITSHKSQGSTYDMVIVDESDIMSVPIDNKSKSQSIYTGLTRAKNISMVINSSGIDAEYVNINDVNSNIEEKKGDTRGVENSPSLEDEIIDLPNGNKLLLPKEAVSIKVRGGIYIITSKGDVINNTKKSANFGNTIQNNAPIYYDVIEQYQEQQANDLNKYCK